MTPGYKILIVEDEALVALCLRKELTSLGYWVSPSVATGEAAVQSVEQNPPDLILMDIRLAGKMNGIEAAGEIVSRRDIPIIFMSGYEDQDLAARLEGLNPAAHFIKPLDTDALDSAMKTILRKRTKGV